MYLSLDDFSVSLNSQSEDEQKLHMIQEILKNGEEEAEEAAIVPVGHLDHGPQWCHSKTREGVEQGEGEKVLVKVSMPQGATMGGFVQKDKVSHKSCHGQQAIDGGYEAHAMPEGIVH